MQLSIQRHDALPDSRKSALAELETWVYPPGTFESSPEGQLTWTEPMWSVVVWDDHENLVSHVGVVTRQGTLDGQPVLLGGVGSVMTAPQARGRGYAGAACLRAASFLADECHVDFSQLVCKPTLVNYYDRFGWRPFAGDLFVAQPAGRIKFTLSETMVLNGQMQAPHDGFLDLCGLPW